uniref:acylaminoacyl-peptidase n=1 Tax=Heliconius erato TaxID=33431 RepID=L7X3U3_HELEA|nr:acylamino-acid-releasing enzyme-like protein [Heliconius erato]
MEHVIKAYKTLTKIPSIVGGRLNNKGNRVTSRWSIRNLDKGRNTQYFIDYILDDHLGVIAQSDFGTDISHELLTAVSPNESFKAVIREEKDDKDSSKKKFFLEVWSKSCLKHSIDLTSLDIHGDVYADSEFGSLDWSPDEKQLVYVAEKKVKKSEPFIKRKPAEDKTNADKKPVPGEEHLYREDWGEQLIGKYQTVVVVCNVDEEKFTILENIPENWCPGQVRFTPSGDGIVGVAWDISGVRRLGLIYCTNRPSYIFCSSLNGGLRKLSPENRSVRSPRFSPTGDLVWLQREAQGPHHACHQLVKMAADKIASIVSSDVSDVTDKISILIDIVQTEKEISNGIFYGIYSQNLPSKGFSSDGKRLVFSTQQQNEIRSYVVDIESGNIVDISNNKEVAGSTSVLSVQSDVILATFSNMNTPGQLFAAKLPSAGDEQNIEWKRISTPQVVPSSIANGKLEYMNLKHENSEDTVSIYFGPNEGNGHPLVVWPHGGPHSAFVNAYSLEAAFFNLIGFACVLINYRGSAGSGDSSIHFLPGRIGSADVADCKLATDKAVDQFPINNEKLMLYGGSHGGFLVTHLSGLHSDVYKATVARNPVIDLASMNNTSDIADWCSVEAGFPFQEGGQELNEKLLALRKVSPIVHANNVTVPTALMLGSKDKRVPYYQGLEYSRKLKANGVHTKVFTYEDNHALSSLPVEMDNLINGADWFIEHIKPIA